MNMKTFIEPKNEGLGIVFRMKGGTFFEFNFLYS